MAPNCSNQHIPVLLEEAVAALQPQPDGWYLDCTFGRGGHTRHLLQLLGSGGRITGFDTDPVAVEVGSELMKQDPRFSMFHARFSDIGQVLAERGDNPRVNGVLFDLGVSSPQLDDPERGFSFREDGPLDMRMNPQRGTNVSDWLGRASGDEIATVIRTFGEERYARRIARAIVRERDQHPLVSTARLAALVKDCVPRPSARARRAARTAPIHPATRTFQALRIFINREIEQLEQALAQTPDLLAACGRLVVISFHSLEDRVVKRFIRDESRGGPWDRSVRTLGYQRQPRLKKVGKPIYPSAAEIAANPRARSAILRVAEARS